MQLNKFLAYAAIASRRKAVELIRQGSVRVNNKVVTEPGYVVQDTDIVTVHGKRVVPKEPIYILLNKPAGYITTVSDEKGRATVMDLLGKHIEGRLYPVGRLDRNTTGLLLFTNDGELAQQLSHPRYEITKVYQVTLHKTLHEQDRQKIIKGVRLADGIVQVDRISHPLGPRKNVVRLTLHSGKYRVVRRLFQAVGYQVKKLDRIQYATLTKRGLPVGGWRQLSQQEVNTLKKLFEKRGNNGAISKN
jgi:23S rRNA pseudouridine2605 synthase